MAQSRTQQYERQSTDIKSHQDAGRNVSRTEDETGDITQFIRTCPAGTKSWV